MTCQLLPPAPPVMLLLAQNQLLLAWHSMLASQCAASSAHAVHSDEQYLQAAGIVRHK
jgi:hypothetical protein